jgi:hypothetical protein
MAEQAAGRIVRRRALHDGLHSDHLLLLILVEAALRGELHEQIEEVMPGKELEHDWLARWRPRTFAHRVPLRHAHGSPPARPKPWSNQGSFQLFFSNLTRPGA